MTERRSFYRKLAYLGGIVMLLFPLAMLSAPMSKKSRGGKLAIMRTEQGLAQANLGEIDPASETIKLATLGMRGIAVNLLWNQAHEFKKTENWSKLTATLDQLAKLQPNFISFWKFQAWNVTYNVSVEFDDYHDRYHYVREGINFLEQGKKYNQYNPKLLWDLGWFIGQKIGRADEHVEYRRLFKNDDIYWTDESFPERQDVPREDRDNWLFSRTWYDQAVDAVDHMKRSLEKKSPVVFYSSPAMSLMNYADAIETEGVFGRRARTAWENAEKAWDAFGHHVVKHSSGVPLQLGDSARLLEQTKALSEELDAIIPGTREELAAEKQNALTAEERALLDMPFRQSTPEQQQAAADLNRSLQVTGHDVANRIAEKAPEKEKEAMHLVREIERSAIRLRYTQNYKQTANYDYWLVRAQFEQTSDALNAREAIFAGELDFEESNFEAAKEKYLEGFRLWRNVLDAFPLIADDSTNGEELLEVIKKYRDVLDQQDKTMGDDFPLWDVIENHDVAGDFTEELEERKKETPGQSAQGIGPDNPESSEKTETDENNSSDEQPSDESEDDGKDVAAIDVTEKPDEPE